MRALLLVAPLALAQLSVVPAEEAEWLSRLELPELARYEFDFMVDPFRLGLEQYDPGFPEDAQLMVSEAERRLETEAPTPRLLHQAAQGYTILKKVERAEHWLGLCLEAYTSAVASSPDDFDLRMGFAHALELPLLISQDPSTIDEARAQLAEAARIAPDDWLVPHADARMCLMAAMAVAAGGVSHGELIAAARAGIARVRALAPERMEAAWMSFSLAMVELTLAFEGQGEEESETWLRGLEQALTDLRSELRQHPAKEQAAAFSLVAEGWRILTVMGPFLCDEVPEPRRAELRESLRALYDQLDTIALDEYHEPMLAEVAWAATLALGLDTKSPAQLERAVAHGLPRASALGMALKPFGGDPGIAELFAVELAEIASTPRAHGALALYRYRTGEFDAARAAIADMTPSIASRVADAIVALRLGERKEARRVLTSILFETNGDGPTLHALGVALALDGRWRLSLEQLGLAVSALEEPEAARLTLDEVRARAAADGK